MLETGFNYLIYEEKTEKTFTLLNEIAESGVPCLCISTLFPNKAKKLHGLEKVKLYWLSDSADSPDTMSPTRLEFEIAREINKFIRNNEESVIVLDGFGYLTLENEYDKVRKAVKRTCDLASMNNGTFVVVVNPNAFSKETLTTLSRDFDKVGDVSEFTGGEAAPEPAAPEPAPAPAPVAPAPPPAATPSYTVTKDPVAETPAMPVSDDSGSEDIEIEDIYLIHRTTGTLIQRRTWRDSDLIDPDLVGSMFQAILDFINNSFAGGDSSGSEFSRIDVKGYIILIGDGVHVSLALVFSGKAEEQLAKAMGGIKKTLTKYVSAIENEYKKEFEEYDGDVSKLRGTRKELDYFSMEINEALEGKSKKAKKKKISPQDAKSVNDLFHQAALASRNRQYKEALRLYNKALDIDPGNEKCLFNKAVLLQMTNDIVGAIEAYDQIIEVNPNDPEVWSNKGIAHRGIGQSKEALACYEKGLEINPNDATLWSNRGIVLRSLGKIKEALESYDKSLEINPYDAGVWSNKGVLLGSMGLLDDAIKCYDKALEISPGRKVASRNREIALKELEKRGKR